MVSFTYMYFTTKKQNIYIYTYIYVYIYIKNLKMTQ